MNIFVTKLDSSTQSEDLRTLFEEFGSISSAKVIIDRETGNSKCFGFVEMNDETEGMNAINALNDTNFQGSFIIVKKARDPQNDRRDNTNNRGYHDNHDNREHSSNRGNKKVILRGSKRSNNNKFERTTNKDFDQNSNSDYRNNDSSSKAAKFNTSNTNIFSDDEDDSFEAPILERSYDNNIDTNPSRIHKFTPNKKTSKKGKNSEDKGENRKKIKKYNKNSERKNFKAKLYLLTDEDDDF